METSRLGQQLPKAIVWWREALAGVAVGNTSLHYPPKASLNWMKWCCVMFLGLGFRVQESAASHY